MPSTQGLGAADSSVWNTLFRYLTDPSLSVLKSLLRCSLKLPLTPYSLYTAPPRPHLLFIILCSYLLSYLTPLERRLHEGKGFVAFQSHQQTVLLAWKKVYLKFVFSLLYIKHVLQYLLITFFTLKGSHRNPVLIFLLIFLGSFWEKKEEANSFRRLGFLFQFLFLFRIIFRKWSGTWEKQTKETQEEAKS